MVNKDFCLSSYMAFRYIWKDGIDFAEGFQHKNFLPLEMKNRVAVRTSKDMDREIQKQFDELYSKYQHIGILLSGPEISRVGDSFQDTYATSCGHDIQRMGRT